MSTFDFVTFFQGRYENFEDYLPTTKLSHRKHQKINRVMKTNKEAIPLVAKTVLICDLIETTIESRPAEKETFVQSIRDWIGLLLRQLLKLEEGNDVILVKEYEIAILGANDRFFCDGPVKFFQGVTNY